MMSITECFVRVIVCRNYRISLCDCVFECINLSFLVAVAYSSTDKHCHIICSCNCLVAVDVIIVILDQ